MGEITTRAQIVRVRPRYRECPIYGSRGRNAGCRQRDLSLMPSAVFRDYFGSTEIDEDLIRITVKSVCSELVPM